MDSESAGERPLRPGDVVEVRSPAEILATLDNGDALESMPFMPEMLAHAGRRYKVSRRVDKICDTVTATGSRRLHATVYLDDLRCDGSAHDGCQAGCRLYWKEAWLRRVDTDAEGPSTTTTGGPELERVAQAGTRTVREAQTEEVWRCQATEALKASDHLKTSRIRSSTGASSRTATSAVCDSSACGRALCDGGREEARPAQAPAAAWPGQRGSAGRAAGPSAGRTRSGAVSGRNRGHAGRQGLNRGLSFDREMLPYCGRTLRVKDRVERLIDETTGRMLKIPKDCIILEGAVCSGECSTGRWFCPREIYPFWREAWLRRVGGYRGGRDSGMPRRPGRERLPLAVLWPKRLGSARCRVSESRIREVRTTSRAQKRRRARLQRRSWASVRSATP